MKKTVVIILLILTFSSSRSSAQALLDYSGVVNNKRGQPISGATIRLLITVRDYLEPTKVVYRETQTVTTNRIGRFGLLIGRGAPPAGAHYKSTWINDTKLLKVDVAIAGLPGNQSDGMVLQCVKMRKNSNMVFGTGNKPLSDAGQSMAGAADGGDAQ